MCSGRHGAAQVLSWRTLRLQANGLLPWVTPATRLRQVVSDSAASGGRPSMSAMPRGLLADSDFPVCRRGISPCSMPCPQKRDLSMLHALPPEEGSLHASCSPAPEEGPLHAPCSTAPRRRTTPCSPSRSLPSRSSRWPPSSPPGPLSG
jgi:hypothetical protein